MLIFFTGFLYDSTGSYNPVFYTAGFILMFATALMLSTKQIQNFQEKLQEHEGCLFGCNTSTKDDDHQIDKFMESKYELVKGHSRNIDLVCNCLDLASQLENFINKWAHGASSVPSQLHYNIFYTLTL